MFNRKNKEIKRLRAEMAEKDRRLEEAVDKKQRLAKVLKETQSKLAASEADVAKYMDLYIRATKADKPAEAINAADTGRFKVPHCSACANHERAGMDGRYVHICTACGETKRIKGNDTRTSPKWCPLRATAEGVPGGGDQ